MEHDQKEFHEHCDAVTEISKQLFGSIQHSQTILKKILMNALANHVDPDTELLILTYCCAPSHLDGSAMELTLDTLKVSINLRPSSTYTMNSNLFCHDINLDIILDPAVGINYEYSYLDKTLSSPPVNLNPDDIRMFRDKLQQDVKVNNQSILMKYDLIRNKVFDHAFVEHGYGCDGDSSYLIAFESRAINSCLSDLSYVEGFLKEVIVHISKGPHAKQIFNEDFLKQIEKDQDGDLICFPKWNNYVARMIPDPL